MKNYILVYEDGFCFPYGANGKIAGKEYAIYRANIIGKKIFSVFCLNDNEVIYKGR